MGLRKISPLNLLPRKRDYPHPYIPELIEELRRKRVDRREFLRTSTLLGLSAASAYAIADRITGQPLTRTAHAQAGKGGVLKIGTRVQEMTDPSTFDWTPKANVARMMVEYLVMTGPDNVTRPYLAERWQASPDLKTWTFFRRRASTGRTATRSTPTTWCSTSGAGSIRRPARPTSGCSPR
jgi:peptide/nickel transport system substrate-binding protein